MNDIKVIEREAAKIDELQENHLPQIKALQDQITALEEKRGEALISQAMGTATNGAVERIGKQIEAQKQDLADKQKLAEGLIARKEDLRIQEQAIRLGLMQTEYKALCPEVEKLAEKYLAMRQELHKVVNEYNEKHRKAERLRPAIQTLRHELNVGQLDCGDLASLRNLHWTDQHVRITTEQLEGSRPW